MKRHCMKLHQTKAQYLDVGEKPSQPKFINQDEFQKDPANVKPIKKHKNWSKPLDMNLGQLKQERSSLVSSSESSESGDDSDDSAEEVDDS